ncbi:MAG: diguanylate cyclase [Thermoanaerobacteraceae bacterium]|nr:diguanylate cyclase [Thermoanaerobacteraceae bacterium]
MSKISKKQCVNHCTWTPRKLILKLRLFLVVYAGLVIGPAVWQAGSIVFLIALAGLAAVFVASQFFIFQQRELTIWELISFITGFVLLNCTVILTGGYHSTYLFLYLIPVGTYSISGRQVLGGWSLVLNTTVLVLLALWEAYRTDLMLGGQVFYLTGIIFLMYFKYLLIFQLIERYNQLRQETDRLIKFDDQTRLLRYSCLQPCLVEKIKEWHQNNKSFALLIIDLGSLKYFNSKYGYKTGDKLIENTARVLCNFLGDEDQAFRYAGDQFAVLTRMTDEEIEHFITHFNLDVARVADKLNVEKLNIVTGRAYCPQDGTSPEELLDQAMADLEAKKDKLKVEKMEQQKRAEKMALVGQLAAGLAHELRNPLTSVKGFCHLIKENIDDPKIKEYLNYMDADLTRISDLIGEFLLLSKPSAPQLEVIDAVEFLQEIIDFLESQARLQDISVMMQIPGYLPKLHADKEQLRQAIINVMVNSFEAMPDGGEIYISLAPVGDKIGISIEDTGHGIPEENLQHILNPFFTTKEEGTGLGLSVTQRIVASHGGDIVIKSRENEGTVVTLYLPLAKDNIGNRELTG